MAERARFFLKHYNGDTHGVFYTGNAAYACQQGLKLDPSNRDYFHFVDAEGNTVVLRDQPRYPGHAYAIMAALDRAVPGTED